MEDKKIILVYGPMKSGKSAMLIDIYNNLLKQNTKVECFKNKIDTRDFRFIKSRKYEQSVYCTMLDDIKDCLNSKADVIMLDEFQFVEAETILYIVNYCKTNNKALYIFGLDKIADGKEWPSFTIIKNIVDEKIKLTAKCEVCGDVAEYTKLENYNGESIQIENGETNYFPVCKKCFLKNINNIN